MISVKSLEVFKAVGELMLAKQFTHEEVYDLITLMIVLEVYSLQQSYTVAASLDVFISAFAHELAARVTQLVHQDTVSQESVQTA